ncbi:MAG: AsmA family protein [Chromatiales bacterium]|nr:AsmA family protein [Chromatiales bacterium]
MKRLLKWLFGLAAALVVLIIVVLMAATLLIDPNDYRDTIATKVKEQTGRELTIESIKLTRFPWLGLELGAIGLGNAKGFGTEPMARIAGAEARVKLLPLFKLQTEIDTVTLRGLELNLKRRADGVSNWDDLARGESSNKEEKTEQSTETGDPQQVEQILRALAIGGIIVEDANVSWDDRQNKQSFSLKQFNFTSGEIRIAEAIPLKLSANLASTAPSVSGSVQFSGSVTADPLSQQYRLDGLSLAADAKGEVLPGGTLQARVAGSVAVDLKEQSLKVDALTLSALGMEVTLNAGGGQIIDKPAFSGDLAIKEFVPRQLLADLGITLPEMADPSAMGKANLTTRFKAGLDNVSLSGLKLQLDDTTFGGDASVSKFATPVIRYTLKLDEIDIDRYLPPPSDQPAGKEGAAATAAAQEPELPLKLLRSLDIDGSFNIDKVKVMNLRTDTIVTTVKAKGGKFRIHPLSANMYEGSYSGDLGFDVTGNKPQISMNEKISGVQAGPLFKDFMGKPHVTGAATMQAKLTAQGLTPQSVRSSLNGNGSFKFANGTVNGINIGQKIRDAYAMYKKAPKPEAQQSATDFANLSGSFSAKDGLITTSDLTVDSPMLQVDGKGDVNLVSERLDLRLDTVLAHDEKDLAAGGAKELQGTRIPLTIKGTFSDPKFGVDFGSIFKAKVDAEVEKKKAEAKAEIDRKKKAAEAEAKKKLDAEKKRLEEQAKDRLKKMLKF